MNNSIAVGYVRVSTEDQTENFSLQFQKKHIEEYCRENKIKLKTIYDENFSSGSTISKRPVFQEMMDTVLKSQDIKYVVVLADHRFSRDHVDAVTEVKKLAQKNKYLITINDGMNTEYPDKLMVFQLKSVISEMTRKQINFNTIEGMRQRAQNGLFNGGRITGYKSYKDGLKVVEDQAALVLDIFEKYTFNFWGYRKIAEYLNNLGHRTITNERWTITAVKTILENSIYIGKVKFEGKEFDGAHQPIISKELWDQTQLNLKARSKMSVNKRVGENFLAGIIKCPECEGSMIHHSQKNYSYYQCSNNKIGKSCSANLVYKELVENVAIEYLQTYVSFPTLAPIFKTKNQKRNEERVIILKATIKQCLKNKQILEKKLNKTYDLFYESRDELHKTQINKLNNEIQSSIEKIASSNKELQRVFSSDDDLEDTQNQFITLFRELDFEEQKTLVNKVIKEIHIEQADKPKKRGVKKITPQFSMEDFPILINL